MKAFFLCFTLLFCTLFVPRASVFWTQEPVYVKYTVEDGLPSNTVYYTFQDSKGYLWIATDKGVVRFDGIHFRVFTTAHGLADNECFDIYEDKQQRIWFASYNGEPSFYLNGVFYNKKNTPFLQKIAFKGPAFKIMQDFRGDLFYLTYKAIYRLRGSDFTLFDTSAKLYTALVADDKNNVYALSSLEDKGLQLINLSNGEKQLYPHLKSAIQINSKACFQNGKIYFHNENYLSSIDLKKKQEKHSLFTPEKTYIQFVTNINGKLWIGTNRGFSYKNPKAVNFLFSGKSVSSIIEDKEKNIWISTLNDGIYQIINPNVSCYNAESGLGFDNCISIHKLGNSAIGIGSSDFLFAILNGKKVSSYSVPKQFGNGIIKRIVKAGQNHYLCTGASFVALDNNFNIKKNINASTKDFYIDEHNQVYFIGGSNLLVQPLKVVLGDRNFESVGDVKQYPIKGQGISVSQKKELFVYGLFGILQIKNGKLLPIHHSEYLSKNILDVYTDENGIVWMASSVYGLLAAYKGKVYQFDAQHGLPSHYVTSIVKGKNKQLWIGTNKGLCLINYAFKNQKLTVCCKTYDRSCGLASNIINDVLYANDSIWAATLKGLCVMKASDLNLNKKRPILNLTEFYANGKPFILRDTLFLKPDFNRIKLEYKGISFFSLGKIKYKYRLKGVQKEWNYTYSNQLEFPSLNSGNYHLQILVIDAFGKTSEIKNLWVRISPHFYQTWWFILLLTLCLVALAFAFTQYRIRKIKLNHLLKQQVLQLENEKLKIEHNETMLLKEYFELEQKALLLQMNPHFIFNSINTIQGLYKKDKSKGDEYLIKFSNLLRQILEFSKSKVIGLDQEIIFLQNYLDINKLRFENGFEYEIHIDPEIQTSSIGISPMIIQPFVENSLIHGIQSLLDKGKVDLHFFLEDELLICEITDNGIGREKSKEKQKYRIHNSLGLEITEKRLHIFNKGEQHKALQIIDLYNHDGSSNGTKVVVAMVYDELFQ